MPAGPARDERVRECIALFTRAAELGDVTSLFWLGHAYHNGDEQVHIATNGTKAMEMLQSAAGNNP